MIETYEQLIESSEDTAAIFLDEKRGSQLFTESEIMDIKLIAPGWGSSGYYSEEVLKRDGAKAWPAGTHMYIDHPSKSDRSDRPERSIKDLAAVTINQPTYQENGKQGPGLYATAEVFSTHAPFIKERAKAIAVSIVADGMVEAGEAEGRKGRIIKSIERGHSVDFVTRAGAGGMIITESGGDDGQLVETTKLFHGGEPMADTLPAANADYDRLLAENAELKQQVNALRQALTMTEARQLVRATIKTFGLTESVNGLIVEATTASLPLSESGKLDAAALVESATKRAEAVKADLPKQHTASMAGFGQAPTAPSLTLEEVQKESINALVRDGYTEEAARAAIIGA